MYTRTSFVKTLALLYMSTVKAQPNKIEYDFVPEKCLVKTPLLGNDIAGALPFDQTPDIAGILPVDSEPIRYNSCV